MIAAGETGGVLDLILERLADYLEKSARLKRPSERAGGFSSDGHDNFIIPSWDSGVRFGKVFGRIRMQKAKVKRQNELHLLLHFAFRLLHSILNFPTTGPRP